MTHQGAAPYKMSTFAVLKIVKCSSSIPLHGHMHSSNDELTKPEPLKIIVSGFNFHRSNQITLLPTTIKATKATQARNISGQTFSPTPAAAAYSH